MDTFDKFTMTPTPTSARPLLGLTVLVVEDSRFACEAIRLLCLRSGARIRRADCLRSARRHLQAYRPSVLIADLGLPDGSGADLIRELSQVKPRVDVILAISGDSNSKQTALDAGADAFISKPMESLAAFQEIVLSQLPADQRPRGPRVLPDDMIAPDMMAYQDDMAHVADVISNDPDDTMLEYLTQFLSGVAQSARDQELMIAVKSLASDRMDGKPTRSSLARLSAMVQERVNGKIAI
ncbi:response regulator [Parasulfitobacter algicola]|uniref:Response regulator n=1 Tax=Parasulfitobacter algicola TaxID=2614809 RepID=A0ABX2IUS5_9RHOB|nr:response regulator [Sulfitobacter algicola]NSX56060.1 response regulator [Sulfitobacter algicola]